MIQQIGHTGGVNGLPLQLLEDLHGEGDHQRDQAVGLAGGMLRHPHELGRDLREGQVDERGVQQRVEQLELRFVQIRRQPDDLVAHDVVVGHDHGDKGIDIHHDQVVTLDGDAGLGGGQSKRGVMGHTGDQFARLVDDLVQLRHLAMQGFVDALGLLNGEFVLLHQFIDVDPVAGRRGDTSGGGVGLLQQAQLFQARQFVAHGGGRYLQPGQL